MFFFKSWSEENVLFTESHHPSSRHVHLFLNWRLLIHQLGYLNFAWGSFHWHPVRWCCSCWNENLTMTQCHDQAVWGVLLLICTIECGAGLCTVREEFLVSLWGRCQPSNVRNWCSYLFIAAILAYKAENGWETRCSNHKSPLNWLHAHLPLSQTRDLQLAGSLWSLVDSYSQNY